MSMQISINWLLIFIIFFTSVDVSNAYVVKISLWIFDPFLEDTHTDGQLSVGLGIGWRLGVGDEGEGEGSLGVAVSASRVDPTLAWWHLRWRVRSSFIIQTGRRIKNRTVCRYMKPPLWLRQSVPGHVHMWMRHVWGQWSTWGVHWDHKM